MHEPDTIRSEAREYIDQYLAGAFMSPEAIREQVLETLRDRGDIAGLDEIVDQELGEAQAVRRAVQKSWPSTTDCDRLDAAFEELNAAGILARHNWTCCNNCGRAEMPDEFNRLEGKWQGVPIIGYTFYHMQDVESAVGRRGICLNYGSTERAPDEATYEQQCLRIAKIVQDTLGRHGLTVQWNGTYDQKITVPLDWKRRAAPARFCGS